MTLKNFHHKNFNVFRVNVRFFISNVEEKENESISLHLLDDWTSNLNFGGKNPQKNVTLSAFSFFVMSQICAGYCCARLAQTGSFLLLYPLYGLSQLTLQGSLFATTGWVKAREKSWPPAK